tara:strand:+ start:947 stop:1333 length:387 start_codon:yes stop_codon:yes gene_type:complete
MTTSATGQTLKVIPRLFNSVNNIVVRDNSTNESFTYTNINTSFSVNNYMSIVNQGSGYVDSNSNTILKEGRFYDLSVFGSSSTLLYKDKIFVTDQTINQANNNYYDINSGEYTTDSQADMNDNDYIII